MYDIGTVCTIILLAFICVMMIAERKDRNDRKHDDITRRLKSIEKKIENINEYMPRKWKTDLTLEKLGNITATLDSMNENLMDVGRKKVREDRICWDWVTEDE